MSQSFDATTTQGDGGSITYGGGKTYGGATTAFDDVSDSDSTSFDSDIERILVRQRRRRHDRARGYNSCTAVIAGLFVCLID